MDRALTFLVVEDNPSSNQFIANQLKDRGHRIAGQAFSGVEGVELTSLLAPDVVVLDLQMIDPETRRDDPRAGIKAARAIQARCPTPVVVLTAYEAPELFREASAAGVGAYLLKPPNAHEIERAAHIALARFDDMQAVRRLNQQLQAEMKERQQIEATLCEALENSRQHEAEIATLLTAARAVLENRRFVDTAQAIFAACKGAIGATAGYVALLDASGAENEVLFLDSGGLPCTVDPQLPMPIRGLRAEAYRNGQVVYDNHFAHSDWTQYLPSGHVEMRNVLFAPLVIEGKAVGLLGLANKDGEFTARDAEMAMAFGEVASIALQNSLNLQALEESQARLLRSNADLEHFAYVISHDLQEPLRMISSYMGLLNRRYSAQLDEAARDYIAYAVDGARRLHEMIGAILDYSRVDTRGRAPAPTDSEALLAGVLSHLQMAIDERGALVTHDPLPTVMADEVQLAQVLQNLIANALKFCDAQSPRVHVSARRGDGEWQFSVRDNGIGIDPKFRERIFLMFQRLHTHAEYPGTGIGLALCRRIVERHGGRIWVESQPGEGSTFYFTIPDVPPVLKMGPSQGATG